MTHLAPLDLMEYRGFVITRAPLHVPHTWEWSHPAYDGAPERIGEGPADHRCGYADTLSECYDLIDEQIREGV